MQPPSPGTLTPPGAGGSAGAGGPTGFRNCSCCCRVYRRPQAQTGGKLQVGGPPLCPPASCQPPTGR